MQRSPRRPRGRVFDAVVLMLAALLVPSPALADDAGYEEAALSTCPDGDLHCVRQIEQEMKRRTRDLARSCDHDVVFALVYMRVTEEYRRTVESDPEFFSDPAWVNRLGVAFAGYYFGAYDTWHDGKRRRAPDAWDTGFDAAERQDITASGNLLEGVNAHIARDLAVVLAGIGDLSAAHKRDFDKVNRILRKVYPEALDEVARRFDPSIRDGDVEDSELDEDVLFQSVVAWREEAWRFAQRLRAAITPADRAAVATAIEENAESRAESFRAQTSYVDPVNGPQARNAFCEANG